jgi:hypothetical protein
MVASVATERTVEFGRNGDLERLLGELSATVAPLLADSAAQRPEPNRPVLFVIGPPRCGSTYLLQRLAATGSLGYPSNIVARFHSAPHLGAMLHRLLLDPSLDYRGEMSGIDRSILPASDLGKTPGPANVNEFWYAWRPFLPSADADELTAAQLADVDGDGLRSMVAALEAGFERPVALKAQLVALNAELLADLFPTAVFLRLRRRPAEVVESILRARVRHTGSPDRWWSLRPLGWQDWSELSPEDQVALQVTTVEHALDRARPMLEGRLLEIDFDELRDRPELVDRRIARHLEPLGVDLGPVELPALAPPRSAITAERAAELTAAVTRARVGGLLRPTGAHERAECDQHQHADAEPLARRPHELLYTTAAFGTRNLRDGDRWVRIDHHDGDRLVGSLSGTLTGGALWSGYSAPFGGPDLVRSPESPANLTGLLDTAIVRARELGARRLRITLRPPSYSANEPLLLHCATRLGFRPIGSELSCAIPIGHHADADAYTSSLKRATRKALRRLGGEPWSYREVLGDWSEPYALLQRNRARKGRELRLSLDYVEAVRRDHPGRLRCFELVHDGVPVAAALLYSLLDDVESVQYWGDDAPHLRFSPMPRLAVEVVGRAIDERLRLVDLGKSSLDGVPDEGLVQFKRSVGALPEPILTVERIL